MAGDVFLSSQLQNLPGGKLPLLFLSGKRRKKLFFQSPGSHRNYSYNRKEQDSGKDRFLFVRVIVMFSHNSLSLRSMASPRASIRLRGASPSFF